MDFQEFSQQNQPQKSTSEIISHAFETYKGVFLYAILAMVLYFVASMLIQPVSYTHLDVYKRQQTNRKLQYKNHVRKFPPPK